LNISNPAMLLLQFLFMLKVIRNQSPDVIQTWMYHADLLGGIAARLVGVRNIYWGIRHSNLTKDTVKKRTLIIAKLCAYLSPFIPRKIICCSSSAAISHQLIGYKASKFVIIPNGYFTEKFDSSKSHSDRCKEQFLLSNTIPVIGMVARYNPQKDHINLFDALTKLSENSNEYKCVLVGREVDNHNAILTAALADRGITKHVKLLGVSNIVPEFMSAIDIHVLSSSAGEAFPNVLAEAMASGTPCVATDVGDSSFIVGNTGWIIEPRNSQLLYEALVKAIDEFEDSDNWNIRKSMARMRIVQNFSINKMVESYNEAWV
ncbi:glycosyltransferase, partial [Oceanospirillaceae bacterium]|nr:glycosyltransferase [Oceanospirillaceae bacterium]